MAHQLYTPQQAVSSALSLLRYQSVLPRLVNNTLSNEFVPGKGATVNIPKPITLNAPDARKYTKANRDARDAIVFDELQQDHTSVTLDTQIYKAVRLPDDFMTFTLTDLSTQVLAPMVLSMVDGVTKPLTDLIAQTPTDAKIPAIAADGSNALTAIIQARAVLNARKVPQAGRVLAVGAGVEAAILQLPQLQKVNEAGTGDMLHEARIARLFGFDIVTAPELPENFAVAFERDAYALLTRTTAPAKGAAFCATQAGDGFSMRYLQHYNPWQLEDQAVLDTFAGAAVLDDRRAVSLKLA